MRLIIHPIAARATAEAIGRVAGPDEVVQAGTKRQALEVIAEAD
jgi:hypothetical protein